MALWTPSNLATAPAFWFDASDSATIVTDANGIVGWADKTGNGIDAFQTTPAYQPQLVENQQNGLSVVRFGSGSRFLFSQTRESLDKTLIAIGNSSAGGGLILGQGSTRMAWGSTIGAFTSQASWGGSGSYNSTLTTGSTDAIIHVGLNDPLGLYINAFKDGNSPDRVNTLDPFLYSSIPHLTINWLGDIWEILLVDGEPSDADRERIEGYFAHKWGITDKLPPLHPYRNSAPITETVVPVSIPNAPDGARYRISNQSRSNAEIENGIVSGGAGISTTFIADDASVPHVEGDTIHVDVTYPVSTTAYLPSRVIGLALGSGVSGFVAQADDEIYNFHGIDGSAITKFQADYVQDDIEITISSNFVGAEIYAFYVHTITSESGIREWLGAITAIDKANFEINVDVLPMLFDNQTSDEVWQTDNVRIFRSDGVRPVRNPTTGGGGIDVNWRSQVFIAETGVSGLTAAESLQLNNIANLATTTQLTIAQTSIENNIAALNNISVSDINLALASYDAATETDVNKAVVDVLLAQRDMKDNLDILNTGVKKSSLLIPHVNNLEEVEYTPLSPQDSDAFVTSRGLIFNTSEE